MKKVLAIIMALVMLFCMSSCTLQRRGVSEYQFMYDGMLDVRNLLNLSSVSDSMLGFYPYSYYSHLVLFPKETPSTLTDFYFHWMKTLAYDIYNVGIYFTCTLTDENYESFCNGLADFEIISGENTFKPLYDEEHFSLPTYILQWAYVGTNNKVLEYVMLDNENNTVIFVYTSEGYGHIQEETSYQVFPHSDMDFLGYEFSIYRTFEENSAGEIFETRYDIENAVYDISFLDYLK